MSDAGSMAPLGLATNPFAVGALSEFYFVGGQRRFQLQQAMHGLYIARSIVLLSGERGAGKSHLLATLRGELSGLADCCDVAASVLMDGVAIRRELAGFYRLSPESAIDNSALVAALSRQAPADAEPLPVMLLIDDAHELAVQTLADLQQLVEVARGRVRLLLAGEPTLVTAWQQLPVAAAELLELQPLDLQESADYLQTRLQAAGFRGVLPLSPAQMEKLYRSSGGCIGKLNDLAPAALAAVDDEGVAPSMAVHRLPWRWMGVAAVVLIAVGVALQFDTEPAPERAVSLAGERTTVALSLPVSPAPAAVAPELEPVSVPQRREIVAAPLPETKPKSSAVSASVMPRSAALVPVSAPVTAEAKEALPPVATAAAVAKVVEPVERPKPAVTQISAAPTYRFDEQRLLAMSAEKYVLQLMAVESRAKPEAFLKANAVGAPTLCYEALRGGRRLIVLVAGPYSDRNAAQAAMAMLPEALRATKPWPRTVASVQSDIQAARGSR